MCHQTIEDIHKKVMQHTEVKDTWAKSIELICELWHKDYPVFYWKAKTLVEEIKQLLKSEKWS